MKADVRRGVKEGCKVLHTLKGAMWSRIMCLKAERWLCEGVVVPTVLYDAEMRE